MSLPSNRDPGETKGNRLTVAMAGAEAPSGAEARIHPHDPRPDLSLLIRRLSLGMNGLDYIYWCLEHLAVQFQLEDAVLVLDQPELGHQIFRLRHRSLGDSLASPQLREFGLHLRPSVLGEEDRSTIVALCQSALTLALAKHDAAHDALTGLLNRRSFEEAIGQFVANGVRHGTEFSLALLDVDGLKQINDLTGHWRGDRLLQATGRELSRLMRAGEVAARLGGDEFGLLLVGADPSSSARIRDRLEAAVSNVLGMPTRYSIGVARSGETGVDSAALYRLADSRLYEDKRSGRAQPVMIDTSAPPAGAATSDPAPAATPAPAPAATPAPAPAATPAPAAAPAPATPPDPAVSEVPDSPASDSEQEAALEELSIDRLSAEDQNQLELRLRRIDAIVWATISAAPSGTVNIEVAARHDDRSWRERIISELQAETGGAVGLHVFDFDPIEAGPVDADRPARVKVESVRQRMQYSPGADPIPGIEVQLSHGGRKGTGFAWDAAPTAAVKATLAALAALGLSVPYEIESVTRLGFSSSAPVLTVLRCLGTGESRMGVVRRPDAMDAAVRAMLSASNRDIELELQGLVSAPSVSSAEEHQHLPAGSGAGRV